MADKSKSLRQKRGGKINISAPTLISAPQSASNSITLADARAQSSRPSTASTTATTGSRRDGGLPRALRPGGTPGQAQNGVGMPTPIPRARNDQTADLVKRRYSTRFTNAPSEGFGEAPPVPTMPSIPSIPRRFATSESDEFGSARRIPIDPALLKDANLDVDKCESTADK